MMLQINFFDSVYCSLIKRNCQKFKLKPDKSNAHEVEHRVHQSLYLTCLIVVSQELVTLMIRQIQGQIKSILPADANGMRVVLICSTIKKKEDWEHWESHQTT